jgi:di/tricarboxylate transporter
MDFIADPSLHMWFVLGLAAMAAILYIREEIPIEVTSIALLASLLLFGQFMPLYDDSGSNLLDPKTLLSGFSNPSLIAVLALLVMGQAMIHTHALRPLTDIFTLASKKIAWLAIIGILIFVMVCSAFMNNTPLVIIAIPLIQSLARTIGVSESRLMIPLSYVAILGGMTTLIGSSTNLLVSSAMLNLGHEPLGFFSFAIPGMMMASVGFIYIAFVVPWLLPDRATMARDLAGNTKEFVAELDIAKDSKLIGMVCEDGKFPELADLRIKLIQRGGHLILPPFEGYKIDTGDILIVSATRDTLADLLSKYPGFLLNDEAQEIIEHQDEDVTPETKAKETRVLAEIMITPASRIVDMSLDHIGFDKQFGTIVLGIQRRARVVRRRLGRIRIEAGDVLLVAGRRSVIDSMRNNADFIVLSGSKRDLPLPAKAPIAAGVFIMTIALAALDILSIPVAAITGCLVMITTGCLTVSQATRAINRQIFFVVGAMIALGSALQASGGAMYVAEHILSLPFVDTPLTAAAALFLLIAFTTNILTNNACAILYTPIAMSLAASLQVPPDLQYSIYFIFGVTVIFASDCSFASPIGYQTNLLVMGPGHYRFRDYIKSGVPLVGILWVTYILIAKYYFGL